jgi:hypothetical protein
MKKTTSEIMYEYVVEADEFNLEVMYDENGYAYSYVMPDVGCEFDPKVETSNVRT